MSAKDSHPIIFFDGHCPMCHSYVRRIIRWDKKNVFRFAPLEGQLAEKLLGPIFPQYLQEDTIVFYENGHLLLRSDAGLTITSRLGFPYSLAVIGYLLPKKLRDGIYNWIAGRRYRFGQRYDACPIPPVEWKDRFI